MNLKWMVGGQVNPIMSIIIDNNNNNNNSNNGFTVSIIEDVLWWWCWWLLFYIKAAHDIIIKLELVVIMAQCRVGKYDKELSTAIIIVTIE